MSKHQKKPEKNKKKYQTVVSRKNSQPTTNYQLPTTKKILSPYCQQIFKLNNQNQPTKLLWLTLFLGVFGAWSSPALAEGSRELTANGGNRPYLEYRNDLFPNTTIPRRTVIYVYVNQGEVLNLGSSAAGRGGTINYRRPNNTTGTCNATTGIGQIVDRTQEENGPNPPAGGSGYTPCVVNVDQTGVWEIEFVSSSPNATTDPPPINANGIWTQPNNVPWIAAWDVTVRSSASGPIIPGRAYAKYLSLNMGGNNRAINSRTIIQTRDGYRYGVNLNGLDPFGFIFFANNKGFTNGIGGAPLYRSVDLPATFLEPQNEDTTSDYTHKIFFNQPATDLPQSALTPNGPTWLVNPIEPPPSPTNFTFTGIENTPNQAGSAILPGASVPATTVLPTKGRFNFISPLNDVSYSIVVDLNRDGIFGNSGSITINGVTTFVRDKIFYGRTRLGEQDPINWDGTFDDIDANGEPIKVRVPPSDFTYRAQVTLYTGEVHFPLLDAENNPNGIIVERLSPGTGNEIYYDDSRLTVRATDQPSNPRIGFRVPSINGTHRFGTRGNTIGGNFGFGNNRGIDTWAYVPSSPLELNGELAIREADLEIVKTHEPANPSPGTQVTYILTVRNLGPSSLNTNGDSQNIDALVQDSIPTQISNLSVTCEGLGGAICRSQNITGNQLEARVNLPSIQANAGARAVYRITGTLAANVAPGTTIVNDRAIILRPNDVTDPNDVDRQGINNNVSRDEFVVGQQLNAEIRIDKTGPETATAGQNIVYNLAVIAEGTTPSTNVQVNDQIPAGLNLLSISDPACNNRFPCTLGDIPNGQTRNLTVTLAIPENYNGPTQINNTATVTSNNDTNPNNNTDTVPTIITIPQRADVVAVKTGPSTVDPGGTITYNITVTNNGPNAATNVIIRDTLPAGVTFNSASDGGTFNNGTVNFPTIPSLAAGASVNRTITVTAPTTGGPLLNIVASTSDTPDPTPNNNDGSQPPARVITTITPPGADLITTKTGPATVAPGGTITYTITTRNDGPNPATNVIIRDNIPPGTTFSSASDGGTFASGVVSFPPIPSIAPGTSVTRTVSIVAPNSGGPLVNQASNTSDTPDPNPNNNNGSEPPARVTTTIIQTPVSADVVTTKTGPSTVTPNGTITYTITTTNNGPNPATNVVIRDNIPPETTFGSASDGGTFADGVVTFPVIPSIAPGTSVTRTITVTAPASGGPLVNRASNTSDTPDPNPNNNNGSEPPARVTTTITEPPSNADVVTIKSGPSTVEPNGTIIYSITTTNNGPSPATNIVIRDALPLEVTFNNASNGGTFANGVVTFPPIASLAVGESVTRTITATAPAGGGPLVNQASNTSDTPDPNPNNNNGSEPPARVVTTITNTADVVTTKTGPSTVAPNGIITYTITTSNNGPVAATNVVIRDAVPPETTFNSASDGGTFADGVVTFPAIPSLAPNTSVTRTVVVTAPAGGGPLVNRASNTSDTPDSNPSNNDGSQPPARVTTTITTTTANADLVTTKTGPSAVTPGGRISYTITTTNNGPAPASNVIIRDTLPAGATFNGASDGGTIADGVVTFPPIPTIAPGTSISRTVNITAPTSGGPLVNRASNTSDTPDPNPNNNNGTEPPAQVITTITNDPTQIADVVTTKTGPDTAAPGGPITYTITTRNNGPAVATNVVIRDIIPPETTFGTASDGGTFANGAVTFPPIPTLAPGTAVSRTVTVTAPNNAGSVVNRASNTSDTPDPTPSNNDGSQPPARVVTTITSPGTADVVTSKTGPATVNPGGTITYTITVVNNGPNPASNIIVRDTLPQGLTFNNASDGGTFANGVVSFPAIPSLAPGASVTRTITATAPNSGGPFVNQVSSTSDTPDPNPGNNNGSQPPLHQVTTTLAPVIADVQVTQTGPSAPVIVGSNITFTAQVTNISSTTANQVVFTNPLPAGVTFVSVTPSSGTCTFANNTITCNLGDLAPGQNVSIAIAVTATTPGTIVNPVSVNATNDSNPNNNNATAPAEVIVPQTDLAVKINGPTEPQPVGNNVTFNIEVTNTGTAPGNSVVLTNPLPENTTFVSATPPQGTCELSNNNIVCNLGNINPGQTVTVPVVISPSVPGTINNSVSISSPSDTQPTNNQVITTVQIVPREPRLRLVKRITSVVRSGSIALFSDFIDDPADQNDNAPGWSQLRPVGLVSVPTSEPLRSGDTVEYTIYFLSDGTAPADNVNICDAIPTNTTFLADGFGTGTGMQLNLAGAISTLTNVQDSDAGRLFSPLAPLPSGNPCADQANANGSLLFNFNQIPNAAGSNFGFVRFRVRID